jgi:hypothetical protein
VLHICYRRAAADSVVTRGKMRTGLFVPDRRKCGADTYRSGQLSGSARRCRRM